MSESRDSKALLYKETVQPMNQAYNELLAFYSQGDTRAAYLKTFELALSLNCPNRMLWQFPEYKAQEAKAPLPKDPRIRIDPDQFYNYMMVYEQIMREVGLIDKDPMEVQKVQTVGLFDMGDE